MMPSLLENIQSLNLPKVEPPPKVPESVAILLDRLGLTITLTSPSVPEQWEITRGNEPCGFIHTRRCHMSVYFPDVGGKELYEAAVDGFGGFTDQERETRLLLAVGLIAARLLKP